MRTTNIIVRTVDVILSHSLLLKKGNRSTRRTWTVLTILSIFETMFSSNLKKIIMVMNCGGEHCVWRSQKAKGMKGR